MRVLFVIPDMSRCGGIERVCATHASWLAQAGHEVTVVDFGTGGPPFFALHPAVRVRSLTPAKGVADKLREVRALRSAIAAVAPDVVVSIFRNVLTMLALAGRPTPVVLTEHMNPVQAPPAVGRRALARWLYPRASAVVAVSEGIANHYRWLPAGRLHVVPNAAVPQSGDGPNPYPDPSLSYILAAGRFASAKGFDLLIEAYGKIAQRHPRWRLCIIGGTPDAGLAARIRELGLDRRCLFPGVVRNAEAYMRHADLFVLSSRHEALPMVLVEALAAGLPVLSTDCAYGPNEIIASGDNGVLVPPEDAGALAVELDRLLGDEALRRGLASRARASMKRLSLDRVMGQWDALLAQAISGRRSSP